MLAKSAEGIRFHRTILEEFYQTAFRKKLYTSVEQLQQDVDVGLRPAVGVRIDSSIARDHIRVVTAMARRRRKPSSIASL